MRVLRVHHFTLALDRVDSRSRLVRLCDRTTTLTTRFVVVVVVTIVAIAIVVTLTTTWRPVVVVRLGLGSSVSSIDSSSCCRVVHVHVRVEWCDTFGHRHVCDVFATATTANVKTTTRDLAIDIGHAHDAVLASNTQLVDATSASTIGHRMKSVGTTGSAISTTVSHCIASVEGYGWFGHRTDSVGTAVSTISTISTTTTASHCVAGVEGYGRLQHRIGNDSIDVGNGVGTISTASYCIAGVEELSGFGHHRMDSDSIDVGTTVSHCIAGVRELGRSDDHGRFGRSDGFDNLHGVRDDSHDGFGRRDGHARHNSLQGVRLLLQRHDRLERDDLFDAVHGVWALNRHAA